MMVLALGEVGEMIHERNRVGKARKTDLALERAFHLVPAVRSFHMPSIADRTSRVQRMRMALLALVVAGVCTSAGAAATRGSAAHATVEELVGQRLVVAMRGPVPGPQ